MYGVVMVSGVSSGVAHESGHGNSPQGDMLDLGALFRAVGRRKYWIILPTLLTLVGSVVAVNLISSRYTGEARILLESRDGYYTRPGGDRDTSNGSAQNIDPEAVQSQVQVIMSRDLARDAIRRIGLVGNGEFDPGVGILSSMKRIMVLLGFATHPADRTPEDRVLERYYDRLQVYPVIKSRIVAVEFTSEQPELAAKGANTIAEAYLETMEAAKKDTARSASTWLSSAIDPLRKRLAESEAKVEEYRSKAGLQIGTNNTMVTSQQLSDLSGQLATARTAQADSQAKARIIKDAVRSGRLFEVPDVANNDLIRRLIEQRVTMRAQLALESRTLLSEHPRIKELTAQLNDLEGQIKAAAERTMRSLENESRIAGSRVDTLIAAIEGQRKSVGEANEAEVQLRALEREAKAQRDQLEQYMTRYREAVARDADNAAPADARIISRAIEPVSASFPKKLPTILISTLAMMFISFAMVASRELLAGNAAPRDAAPPVRGRAKRKPEGPVAGPDAMDAPDAGFAAATATTPPTPAPRMRSAQEEAAFASAETGEAETVVDVPDDGHFHPDAKRAKVAGLLTHVGRATQVAFAAGEGGQFRASLADMAGLDDGKVPSRLLMIDATPLHGLKARDVARELSASERVVLVDLTDTSPVWGAGLSELISGDASFGEVIDLDETSRLHVITAGKAGIRPVLDAPDLVGLMVQALAETYDRVIIAASATQESPVLGDLLGQSDVALVMGGTAGNGHAVEIAYRLSGLGEAPVGVVLGDAPPRMARARREEMAEA
jgi:polysaccharide biosynthesis transport protein